MKEVVEYFKIIKSYKHIDIHINDDIPEYPRSDYRINGYSKSGLNTHLSNLFNSFKYKVVVQSENVTNQIRKDIEEAKKDFFYFTIEDCDYLFQAKVRYSKYNLDFTSNIDEMIQNVEEGIEFQLEDTKYEGVVKDYNLFSQIKFNALSKLENLLDLNISESTPGYKLKTKLSVGDLSLLFRLLHDEKLFEIENSTEIYRFIAQSFSTKQSINLSDKSIKNKCLTPDGGSIDKMKVLLTNLKIHLQKLDSKISK